MNELLGQDQILHSTRTVCQGLEALKEQHEAIRTALLASSKNLEEDERAAVEEKTRVLNKNLTFIQLGIEEANLMMSLATHLQQVEAEKQRVKAQVKRLCEENAWLRDELNSVQQQHQQVGQQLAQLEEENKHLAYMNSLKTIDEGQPTADRADETAAQPPPTAHTLQELGFEPEEEDEMQTTSEFAVQPTPAAAMAASSSGGAEIPPRLKTLHSLVIQYASQGRYEVAVPLCKQALEDLERNCGHNHPDVASMLNILALVFRDQQKYKEAFHLLNEALSIREKCLGPDSAAVAETLNNLAILHGKCGKYREAEPLCRRALEIRERLLGSGHSAIAKQLNNLAFLCQNQKKFDEVERLHKRACEIYEQAAGPNDPNVTKTKNRLVVEAEEICKDVLSQAHHQEFGISGAETRVIWQIADDRQLNKRSDQAEDQEHIRWLRCVKNNQAVLETLKSLAHCYRKQQKYEAATIVEDLLLRAKRECPPSTGRSRLSEMTTLDS
ncbi:Kinesin light chain (KLC)-like protein [Aphelenchoides fujianensis]|nr:Kinesin light chain (KLC)-like protein [Aphelenchoides fujianensis]